jgi:FixJ family two-component response regulator
MTASEKITTMTRSGRGPYLVSIVEDDHAVRNALGNLLESVGMKVEAFCSAEEFLNSGPASKRACLILDVQLPCLSGLELQRRLAEKKDSVPIIFITAYTDSRVRVQGLQSGALAFFHKPFNSEALLDAVHCTLK